jgi:LPPG:FO 2-phospho-L-lactate transferase
MKVAALAGGVGGAKLVDGLAKTLPHESLTVIVNTGDDFDHLGLRICPDLDTVCYTLAGIANPITGWGRVDETWNVMGSLEQFGGPTWFRLGDRDLGTHLERTRLLKAGYSLSEVTRQFCTGELPFQEYFVRLQCQPQVTGFRFEGIESAQPAPGVLESLSEADLVIICPSNPWVSIDPILALPGVKKAIMTNADRRQVIAVSPIIAGQAVKGPAAKMYREMGLEPSALSVAQHYGGQSGGGLLTGYVFDNLDLDHEDEINEIGIRTLLTNSLMKTADDRIRLSEEVIAFGDKLIKEYRPQ